MQGIIKPPEDYAAGIAINIQGLLGHICGGKMNSADSIIKYFGPVASLLSFEEDYKRVSCKYL